MPQKHGELRTDRWTASHFESTVAPTTTDDSADGFEVGALWVDTVADKYYVCVDATVGAAVWKDLTAAAAGGGDNISVNGTAADDANFGTLPAAPAGGVNVTWQRDAASTPDNISAHLPANSVTNTVLRDSAANSVIGRPGSGTGDPSDISASAEPAGRVLEWDGVDIFWRQVITADITDVNVTSPKIADNAVGDTKLRDSAAASVIGRSAASSGDPGDISSTENLQILQRNTSGVLAWTRAWQLVVKTDDENVNNSATMQDDDHLQFATTATTNYAFRMVVFFDTLAAADFKFQINHTGTTTRLRYGNYGIAPSETAFEFINVRTATTAQAMLATGTTGGFVEIYGVIQVGASGGTLSLQWAQNTATAGNTTVLEGSYLEYAVT